MKIVYGRDVAVKDDPFLDDAETMNREAAHYMAPGSLLVNSIPIRELVRGCRGSCVHDTSQRSETLTGMDAGCRIQADRKEAFCVDRDSNQGAL